MSGTLNGISRASIEAIAQSIAAKGLNTEAEQLLALIGDPQATFLDAWKQAQSQAVRPRDKNREYSPADPALLLAHKLGEQRGYIAGLIRANTICMFKFAHEYEGTHRRVAAEKCSHDISGEIEDSREELDRFKIMLGAPMGVTQ